MSKITFATCWYNLDNKKFERTTYINWISNFFKICNNFNCVLFTDDNSIGDIKDLIDSNKKNIKIIIKPMEEFYNYKYREFWIKNNNRNDNPLRHINWKVNMLWSEKIHFVNEVAQNKYFETEYYGWCDIGYFRNRKNDTSIDKLIHWPLSDKITKLDKDKIHYGLINTNNIKNVFLQIKNTNSKGLPIIPLDPNIVTIGGGFFIGTRDKIYNWKNMYDRKLLLYFNNNYLVKDDQMIIITCILSNTELFKLHIENNNLFDKWFMFQRLL